MSPLVRTLTACAALVALTAPASAQNWQAQPNYGTVNLTSGFTPDPYNVTVASGGTNDAGQSIGGNCTGFVATSPDYDLNFTAGKTGYPLIISVQSDADTTLVVNGPDGNWYCDDDSGDGLNPSVRFNTPATGLYDIWVGTRFSGANHNSTLTISEQMSR